MRADEGIERGPKIYTLSPLDKRRTDNQGKLPENFDLDSIVQRIASGELASAIAHELGVTPPALYHRLANHPEYQRAKEAGHESRLDEAEQWQEGADSALSLARARDIWRARSWRASVEVARRWGQQQAAININANGPITVQVVSWNAPVAPQLTQCNTIDEQNTHK